MILPYYNDSFVSGRGLHELLEIRSRYFDWFARVISRLELKEWEDYFPIYEKATAGRGRARKDHLLTPQVAQEVLVTERRGRAKELRKEALQAKGE